MTSNQHGPLTPWATLVLQWPGQWVLKSQGGSNPIKLGPSSDWGLQLAPMKPESLVIADQPRRGEYVLESCTHNKSAQQRNDLGGSNPLLSSSESIAEDRSVTARCGLEDRKQKTA